jgi:hypothetical protein
MPMHRAARLPPRRRQLARTAQILCILEWRIVPSMARKARPNLRYRMRFAPSPKRGRRAMERRAPRSGNLRHTGLKSHPKTASDDAPMWERPGSSALDAAGAGSCAARGGDQVSSATRGGQCCQPLSPFKISRVPPTLAGLGGSSHIVLSHLWICAFVSLRA